MRDLKWPVGATSYISRNLAITHEPWDIRAYAAVIRLFIRL